MRSKSDEKLKKEEKSLARERKAEFIELDSRGGFEYIYYPLHWRFVVRANKKLFCWNCNSSAPRDSLGETSVHFCCTAGGIAT